MALMLRMMEKSAQPNCLIEAKFDGGGLLFLSLDCKRCDVSPILVAELQNDSVVYAVFAQRGRNVTAKALRSDVTLILKDDERVTSGDGLRIGGREYRMDLKGDGKKSLRVSFILALVSVAVGFWIATYLPMSSPAPLITSAPGGRAEPDTEDVVLIDVNDAVEEARIHLREGRSEQARLALIEAAEQSPGRGEVELLLEATQRSREAERCEDGDENVRELYEEGLAHMGNGDAVAAELSFDAALKEMKTSDARVPFAAALERAKAQAKKEIDRITDERVERVRALLDRSRTKSAPVAVELIAASIREADGVLRANPGSGKTRDIRLEAREALTAAVGRWLARAMEVERLSGCERAVGMYDRIFSLLEGVDDEVASKARRHLTLCEGEGGER